jgi:hypothetical protein
LASATPTQWSNYTLASTVIKLFAISDTNVTAHLREVAYINDRMPYRAGFMNRFNYKIRRQSISNRIRHLFSKITFDWVSPISDHMLRVNLKLEFFTHLATP